MNTVELRTAYEQNLDTVRRFCGTVLEQIQSLCRSGDLALAVPIEHRVKSWQSIEEKLERKSLQLNSVADLDDLVGLRLILLFQRDVVRARRIIGDTFVVHSEEDTASRLEEGQFGYQSWHYIIEIPSVWCAVPTMAPFKGLRAELQIRTLAQHMWAAASHKLQYKQESSVPPTIRRAIYRVSALLETIDLEFERVLQERAAYKSAMHRAPNNAPLDVDVLESVADEVWPASNRDVDEEWAELLQDLAHFSIRDAGQLREALTKHYAVVMAEDAAQVARKQDSKNRSERRRGVFFTHVGLIRRAMEWELGEPWREYMNMYHGVMSSDMDDEEDMDDDEEQDDDSD